MHQVARLDANHADVLHSLVWDYHGLRLATCAADHHICVYDKHPESPSLVLNDKFRAHDAAVTHVRWAHPEHGQILASAAFDNSVRIWEEQEHQPRRSGMRWRERARLVDSRGRVCGLAFAPPWFGLCLATVAEDGVVRVYEAAEVTNVASWGIQQEFDAGGGPSGSLASTAMETPKVLQSSLSQYGAGRGSSADAAAGYCLSWCQARYRAASLAVACGPRNIIRIFRKSEKSGRFLPCETISVQNTLLHDIAWAPNLGRSYHLLAAAGRDHRVRIWQLSEHKPIAPATSSDVASTHTHGHEPEDGVQYESKQVGNFIDHNAEVWRVSWNVTGTILASSGDDGTVRLWRRVLTGEWKGIGVVHAEQQQQQSLGSIADGQYMGRG